jgi:hypothetical protein
MLRIVRTIRGGSKGRIGQEGDVFGHLIRLYVTMQESSRQSAGSVH